jgi:predicted nucleic acid-binding protein
MEDTAMIDACVFIEYFRAFGRRKTYYSELLVRYPNLCVSSIAKYEVLCGAMDGDMAFWESCFRQITVLSFDGSTITMARDIYRQLKRENKLIDTADILIAATAMENDLPLATLNRKHFERIRGLRII